MKILIVCKRFPHISETFILHHITRLIQDGHEVEILAEGKGEARMHPEVQEYQLLEKTTYLGNSVSNDKSLFQKTFGRFIPKSVFRRNFDIIHAHFGPMGLWALDLRERGMIAGKLVVSFHGYDLSREIAKHDPTSYDLLYRKGDLFLPVSEYFRNRLEYLGCPGSKIQVHPVAIDLSKFRKSRALRRKTTFRLVSVARLVEKKGLEYSIQAVSELIRKGYPIEYEIIGQGQLYSKLKSLIRRLGVSKQVRLLGAKIQSEVRANLNQVDAFIAPSITATDGDQEGIPTSILEAMACRLPVISTFHSGIPEVIEDGVHGFLVPEKNSVALAEAIEKLIKSPETCTQMGFQGRKFVEEYRDINAVSSKLVEIYEELLDINSEPLVKGPVREPFHKILLFNRKKITAIELDH